MSHRLRRKPLCLASTSAELGSVPFLGSFLESVFFQLEFQDTTKC